jgi:hypothetical protein
MALCHGDASQEQQSDVMGWTPPASRPQWVAYAGGAMASLFGPTFDILARHGRDFGLSFAAAHLVHVGLIVWLYYVSDHPPALTDSFILFECIGLVWIYVLAAFSTERLRATQP